MNWKKRLRITSETSESKDKQISELQVKLAEIEALANKEKKKQKEKDIKNYIDDQIRKWRQRTHYELIGWLIGLIIGIAALLWKSDWKIGIAITKFKELQSDFIIGNLIVLIAFIFSAITFKKWYDKNHNYSNIENYKKNIDLPEHLNSD